MKAIYWVLSGLMVIILLCISSIGSAYIAYTLIPPQVVDKPVVVEKLVTVEVPKIVEKEVIVTKEVFVTATPAPIQLHPPVIPSTETPVVLPEDVACTDLPVIEMQPKDYIQGDALKTHTLYNVHATLYNAGTCTWEGYKLYSEDSVPPINVDVPYTLPGQRTTFSVANGEVLWPLQYMIRMLNADGEFVPFAMGGTRDGCMTWTLETLGKTPGFNQVLRYGFSSKLTCGAGG